MAQSYALMAKRARYGLFVGLGTLLVVLTLGTLVAPSCQREPNAVMWGVHCLPLVLFLPGLWRRNLRVHAWFCFLLLFYFLTAVPVAFACTSVLTIAEALVIVWVFVAALVFVRWQARAAAGANRESSVEVS